MMRTVDVRLFGAFRQFGAEPTLRVNVAENATIADVRTAIGARLEGNNVQSLLSASAFATDDRMLNDADTVPAGPELAILPPVCGG